MASAVTTTAPLPSPIQRHDAHGPSIASGDKAKARDILSAIRTLQHIEQEQRPPTPDERQALARFPGFGPVAKQIFPYPLADLLADPPILPYKDKGWEALGEALKALLTPEEYDSARRTTFNAFYTSLLVIRAMHNALARLAFPRARPSLSPAAAAAISSRMPPKACASSASSSTASPGVSPARYTPSTTSALRTSATPACPRTASTQRSATCRLRTN
jgi:hypothetical protein